jgi:type II secretory pathway component GspD/PulD (secretin)
MIHLALTMLMVMPAQDTDPVVRREIESKLATRRVSMDFKDVSVDQVLEFMREVSGLNFVHSLSSNDDRKTSFKAKDITLKGALSLMLKPLGLVYRVRDGYVEILTKEKADQDVVMELYDLRDLLYVARDFPGADFTLDPNAPGGMFVEPEPPAPAELPVEELIKTHTGGKSWEENPRASIGLQNGILVVRQTREVHLQIRRLIAQLRNFK